MLISIIAATTIIGLISLIGIILIFNKEQKPDFLKSLISLAAGSLLAAAFLDLLPEAVEEGGFSVGVILKVTLASILFFFLFEKVLHWHHCRCDDCGHQSVVKKNLVFLNLTGDAFHNLIDGFLISSAFMLNFKTGLAVTLAVILHEIPQELADFGILLYAGLTKFKALFYNFLVALTAVFGAIMFYFFGQQFQNLIPLMAAFAAGNFIYLSTADLIPELHHETDSKKIISNSIWLIVGVLLIFGLTKFLPHI